MARKWPASETVITRPFSISRATRLASAIPSESLRSPNSTNAGSGILEQHPKSIEVARRLVDARLGLGRAFELAPPVRSRSRAVRAIVAQEILAPRAVGRLAFEVLKHRVAAVEDAPALQRALAERITPSQLRRGRRFKNHGLDQHGARDEIGTHRAERSYSRRAGGMAEGARALEAHHVDEALEVTHRQFPVVLAVGRRAAVAMTALIEGMNAPDSAKLLGNRAIDPAEKASCVQQHDRRARPAPILDVKADAEDLDEAALRRGRFHGERIRRNHRRPAAPIKLRRYCLAGAAGADVAHRSCSSVIERRNPIRSELISSSTRRTRGSPSSRAAGATTSASASARMIESGARTRKRPLLPLRALASDSTSTPASLSEPMIGSSEDCVTASSRESVHEVTGLPPLRKRSAR